MGGKIIIFFKPLHYKQTLGWHIVEVKYCDLTFFRLFFFNVNLLLVKLVFCLLCVCVYTHILRQDSIPLFPGKTVGNKLEGVF